MDPTIIKDLLGLGPGLVLAAIVFYAYDRHVTALRGVIRENSEAMTKVAAVLEQNCVKLTAHDERADAIQNGVRHVSEVVDRLEKARVRQRTGN